MYLFITHYIVYIIKAVRGMRMMILVCPALSTLLDLSYEAFGARLPGDFDFHHVYFVVFCSIGVKKCCGVL